MVSERDVVAKARALLTETTLVGKITNGADAYLFDMQAPRLLNALANEVERMRPVINAAVEWRRLGYERKDEFSYRIGPLLDAIDIYDTGAKRPREEL